MTAPSDPLDEAWHAAFDADCGEFSERAIRAAIQAYLRARAEHERFKGRIFRSATLYSEAAELDPAPAETAEKAEERRYEEDDE